MGACASIAGCNGCGAIVTTGPGAVQAPEALVSSADVAKATRLVDHTLPFVPRRVLDSFVDGLYQVPVTGGTWLPEPRPLHAAVLLVDVSGFTKLMEVYSKRGVSGCEDFSLLMSDFLSRMSSIIEVNGGDVDCFAGDALLVIFEVAPDRGVDPAEEGEGEGEEERGEVVAAATEVSGASDSDPLLGDKAAPLGKADTLRDATVRAATCMEAIAQELNGFASSPQDPPLRIHGALAAGQVYAIECGGDLTRRWEAFVSGAPLEDLGLAMPMSGVSELIVAHSARQLLGDQFAGEERAGGCLCIGLCEADHRRKFSMNKMLARMSSARSMKSTLSSLRRRSELQSAVLRKVLEDNMRAMSKISSSSRRGSRLGQRLMSFRNTFESKMDFFSSGSARFSSAKNLSSRRQSRVTMAEVFNAGRYNAAAGLSVLFQFMPKFVKARLQDGLDLTMLAEYRHVSVLFITGFPESNGSNPEWLKRLQTALGQVIDHAEGCCGGATRQITIDEKGLAAIFVFGLAGFATRNHAERCAMAAPMVLDILEAVLPCSAGVASGQCYCGLVGNPMSRCEYAVLGDVVNTSARLASHAKSGGHRFLCTDDFKQKVQAYGSNCLEFIPVGRMRLKGKAAESVLFVPELLDPEGSVRSRASTNVFGRDDEVRRMVSFAVSKCRSALDRVPGLAVIQGAVAIGKSTFLDHLASHLERLPADALSSEDAVRPNVIRMTTSAEHSVPFSKCQDLLQALLKSDGVKDAHIYSSLETAPTDKCPSRIRSHSREIARLQQEEPVEATRGFHGLYVQIIRASINQGPLVVLIDDAHNMDEGSLSVFTAIALEKWSFTSIRSGPAGAIIITTPRPLIVQVQAGVLRVDSGDDLTRVSCVTQLQLASLNRDAICGMAMDVLGCTSLEPALAEFITGRSKGNPLHVRELCLWLLGQAYIHVCDEGQGSLEEGTVLENVVLPTFAEIFLSTLDQLSPTLRTVAQAAAILGYRFTEPMLLELLPSSMHCDSSTLIKYLQTLTSLEILEVVEDNAPTKNPRYSLSEEEDQEPTLWQFCQKLQQEAILKVMLQKHRKQLHRKASHLYSSQLDDLEASDRDSAVELYLLERASSHMLQASRQSGSAELTDVYDSTDLITRLTAVYLLLGKLKAGWECQFKLLELLDGSDDISQLQAAQAFAHLFAIRAAVDTILRLELIDNDGSAVPLQARRETLTMLARRLTELATHINANQPKGLMWQRTVSNRSRRQLGGPSSKRQSMLSMRDEGLLAVAELIPTLNNALLNNMLLPPADYAAMREKFASEANPTRQIVYGSLYGLLSLAPGPWSKIVSVCSETHEALVKLNHPRIALVMGLMATVVNATAWRAASVLMGKLWEPGVEAAFAAEVAKPLDAVCTMYCYGTMCVAEAAWEPVESQRVQEWIHKLEVAMLPKVFKRRHAMSSQVHIIVQLAEAQGHARQLWDSFRATGEESVLLLEEEEARSVSATAFGNATRAALVMLRTESNMPLHVVAVARHCIHNGSRVLFLEPGGFSSTDQAEMRPRVITESGWEHLETAAACLAECVQYWESLFLDPPSHSVSLLPSALLWSRAMLHWFQWRLLLAGKLDRASLHHALPTGNIHVGFHLPEPSTNTRIGPTAICSALLLAQSVGCSYDSGGSDEILTGALPATVALARLLRGEAIPSLDCTVTDTAHGERPPTLVVPTTAMGFPPSPDLTGVKFVQPGASVALRTALLHIDAVTHAITTAEHPTKMREMLGRDGVGDVLGSHSLWEAVQLYRDIDRDVRGWRLNSMKFS